MSAAEHPGAPPLPVTWRPRRGRVVPLVLAAAILVVSVGLAVLVPPGFGLADRVAFVLMGALIAGGLRQLARCRIDADRGGVTIVNVLLSREVEWAEIIDVTMPVGEPWPTFDLADGTTVAAMGIQASDGPPARRALGELRSLVRARAEGSEPD